MELRGKNTNNTLSELKKVLADMESGKCSTDGYSGAMADIKEDIAQLEQQPVSLEQAAIKHASYKAPVYGEHHAIEGFKAGANWQKEQDKELIAALKNAIKFIKCCPLLAKDENKPKGLERWEQLVEKHN